MGKKLNRFYTYVLALLMVVTTLIPSVKFVSAEGGVNEITQLTFNSEELKTPIVNESIPSSITLSSNDSNINLENDSLKLTWLELLEDGTSVNTNDTSFIANKTYQARLEVSNLLAIEPFVFANGINKITINDIDFNISNEYADSSLILNNDNSISFVLYTDKFFIEENNVENINREANNAPILENESTEKIEFQIGKFENDVFSVTDLEYYTEQIVPAALDLDISGNDYSIDNPYIIIQIPKTNLIKNIQFIDSAVGSTERYDDDNYYYVKYSFSKLTGGSHYTYPFQFIFDGHYAKTGSEIEAKAGLYLSDGTLLNEAVKKFTAKTVDFDLWSGQGHSSLYLIKDVPTENGHDYTVKGMVLSETDEKTVSGVKYISNVFGSVFPEQVPGISGNVGIEFPKNLKIVYTVDETEPGFKIDLTNVERTGLEDYREFVGKIDGNKAEILIPRPTFNFQGTNPQSNGRRATVSNIKFVAEEITVNKKIPITIDYYANVDENGENGTYLGRRVETYTFIPEVFGQNSRFIYSKVAFNDYNIGEQFGYVRSPIYYSLGEKIFKAQYNMWESGGIPITTFVINTNNGSGPSSPFKGGITNSITEVYSKLESDTIYYRSARIKIVNYNGQNPYSEEIIKAAEDTIKSTGKLYGIDADGNETLITDTVEINVDIPIEDTERKYVGYVFRFDPVVLDNSYMRVHDRVWFIDSEMEKIKEQLDGSFTYYSTGAVTTYDPATNTSKKIGYFGNNAPGKAYFNVTRLHPTVDEYISAPQSVVYSETQTFDYLVGPRLPRHNHDYTVPYGDLKTIDNVKVIALLAPGFEYSGTYEKEHYDANWRTDPINEPIIEEIQNYKGTGRTAVIINYGNIKISKYYPLKLKLKTTKYISRGPNDFVNYMTYDQNDFIMPLSSNKEFYYTDALDLDNDGDISEIYMQKHTTITYIPPLELIITKSASYGGDYQKSLTADLGYDFNFRINVYNNSTQSVKALTVLDTIPHINDYSIAPNSEGIYIPRNSTYSTKLTKSLESVNQAIADKFTFYYQYENTDQNIDSIVSGEWLTESEVTDFSKVKSFKAVLNSGQEIKSKEEVNIYIPTSVPKDKSLDENTSVAANSSAFSLDGSNFTEGNISEVRFATYLVEGIAYIDYNKDGIFNENDELAKGVKYSIINKNGEVTKEFEDSETLLTGVTDENGKYSVRVFKRGDYTVKFDIPNNMKFNDKNVETELTGNSVINVSDTSKSASTKMFALNVSHKKQVKDVALLLEDGKITVKKVSSEEKDASGNPLVLKGVEFQLLTKDKKAVKDSNNEVVENVITDDNGVAVFNNIPVGDYLVKEIKTLDKYALIKDPISASITLDNREVELLVENKLLKGKIKVTKIDDTNRQRKLSGVEFSLKAEDGTIKTLNTKEDGTVLFTDLPYGTYTLYESKGIDGYKKSEEKIAVKVDEDGKTLEYTFVNELINPKITLSGVKVWKDNDNQDGIRPDEVIIKLLMNGNETLKEALASKATDWKYTFTDLDTYDENGDEIKYSVKEEPVKGYTSTIEDTTITNTHTPETREISVSKTWVDNDNKKELRPESIVVRLFANDEEVKSATIIKNENGEYKTTFKDLPVYKEGKKIEYSVKEDEVKNYSTGYSGTSDDGFVITNTIEGKISVPVTKKWIGKEADSINVHLFANDEEIDSKTIDAEMNWQYVFTDLEQYKDGVEIEYSIKEDEIENYESKIEGTFSEGFVITNTNISTFKINVEKTWKGRVKNQIEIILYRDGEIFEEYTISKDDDWKYEIDGLTVYDNEDGHEYKYSIEEKKIPGYTIKIKGDQYDGFIIENREIPVILPPNTSSKSSIFIYLITLILSGLFVFKLSKK